MGEIISRSGELNDALVGALDIQKDPSSGPFPPQFVFFHAAVDNNTDGACWNGCSRYVLSQVSPDHVKS